MHAGKAIQKLQSERGISGGDLAKSMGVAQQQLSRWRQSEDIKLSTIGRLCKAFDVDVVDFINAAK